MKNWCSKILGERNMGGVFEGVAVEGDKRNKKRATKDESVLGPGGLMVFRTEQNNVLRLSPHQKEQNTTGHIP